ncbi:glycosyltransferase [Terrimonas alba]|uniref:glycosyltransferase n=1 Tax=Terrimonas alba TaxID=3349636 RepID=UPI0035F344AA
MLSLVVCSVNPSLLQIMEQSTAATIGIEYELLVFDNRRENLGICEVYNRMAEKAHYPYIVFLHEDLVMKTQNWGRYLVEIFQNDPDIGLVGVAGSDYKSHHFSGWYSGGSGRDYFNITHRQDGEDKLLLFPEKWEKNEYEVVCIDGVFMACPKVIWQSIKFDHDLLRRFHFYDIDFSLRIARIKKVLVTNRIDLVHLTVGGDFGDNWIEQAFIFHEQKKNLMPFALQKLDRQDDHLLFVYWLDWLKDQKISFKNRWRWVSRQKLLNRKKMIYPVLKFLFYRLLGLRAIHNLVR